MFAYYILLFDISVTSLFPCANWPQTPPSRSPHPRQARQLDFIFQFTRLRKCPCRCSFSHRNERLALQSTTCLGFCSHGKSTGKGPPDQGTAISPLVVEAIPLANTSDRLLCDTSTGTQRPLIPPPWRHTVFNSLLITSRFVWPGINTDVSQSRAPHHCSTLIISYTHFPRHEASWIGSPGGLKSFLSLTTIGPRIPKDFVLVDCWHDLFCPPPRCFPSSPYPQHFILATALSLPSSIHLQLSVTCSVGWWYTKCPWYGINIWAVREIYGQKWRWGCATKSKMYF